MARIDQLDERRIEHPKAHASVAATYFTFTDEKGERFLQIDTYGATDREIPGKVSQSLQFGPEGLRALREILDGL